MRQAISTLVTVKHVTKLRRNALGDLGADNDRNSKLNPFDIALKLCIFFSASSMFDILYT